MKNEKVNGEGQGRFSGFLSSCRPHIIVMGVYLTAAFFLMMPLVFFWRSGLAGHAGTGEADYLAALPEKFALYPPYLIDSHLSGAFTLKGFYQVLHGFFNYPLVEGIGSFTPFIFFLFARRILPFPAYYNLYLILIFFLNCAGFYFLGYYLYRNRLIAATAGILWGTVPYLMKMCAELKIEQFNMFWIPLFILFMLRAFREKENNIRNGMAAGFCLAMVSLHYWFYGMFMFFFSLLYGLWYLYRFRRDRARYGNYLSLGVAYAACFILILPFALPYLGGITGQAPVPELPEPGRFPLPSDVSHPINIKILEHSISPGDIISGANEFFIPLTITAAALLSLFYIRKIEGIWFWAVSFFYLLSLGPYLKIAGEITDPPVKLMLYDTLYAFMPYFRRFQWPDRFLGLVAFFMAILGGFGVNEFLKKASPAVKKLALCLFILLIPLNLGLMYRRGYYPIQVSRLQKPGIYGDVRAQSRQSRRQVRILHLPFTGLSRGNPGAVRVSLYDSFNCDFIFFNMMFYMENFEDYNNFPSNTHVFKSIHQNSVLRNLKNLSVDAGGMINPGTGGYRSLLQENYLYAVVHGSFFEKPYNEWNPDLDFKEYIGGVTELLGEPVLRQKETRTPARLAGEKTLTPAKEYELVIFRIPTAQPRNFKK